MGADGGELRLLGVQVGDHRLLPEGDPLGVGDVPGDGVVALPFKGGEGPSRRTGRLGSQLGGLGQGTSLEQTAQILPPGGGQGLFRHIAPGQQHLEEKIAPLLHPGHPDGGAQVGRVDTQTHIALQEGALAVFRQLGHLPEAGPVQGHVGALGVPRLLQNGPGLLDRPLKGGAHPGQVFLLIPVRQQLRGVPAAGERSRRASAPMASPFTRALALW